MGVEGPDGDPFVDVIAQLAFVVHGVLTDTGGRHDLSPTQLRLLGILRYRQPSMQQLARRLRLDKSSVTGLVDRAERRGLLRRESDPNDRRGVRVVITDQGRQLIREAAAEIRDTLALIAEPLTTAQREQLVEAARIIVASAAVEPGVEVDAD